MHVEVMQFVRDSLESLEPASILEIGSQDVNGAARVLCPPGATWFGIDIADGPGVDMVADAATVDAEAIPGMYDVVVCTNVLEHVTDEQAQAICNLAEDKLVPGGSFIVQAAGPGFQVHSGRSESLELEPGEFYRNVPASLLESWLTGGDFDEIVAWERGKWPCDVYAVAVKRMMGAIEALMEGSEASEFVVMERDEFEALVTRVPIRTMAEHPVKVWPLVLDR